MKTFRLLLAAAFVLPFPLALAPAAWAQDAPVPDPARDERPTGEAAESAVEPAADSGADSGPDPAVGPPATRPADRVATEGEAEALVEEEPLTPVDLEEVRRFVSVFRAVQQAYVDPVAETRLMRAAVRGLLTDLDPHSAYLDESDASALNEQASGAYDGLGLEVLQQPDRTLLVVAPIDDTPAARAGIRPGDVIVAIDGTPIATDSVEGAVESMRGKPGTPIMLTIHREGAAAPIEVTLVRETIRVASVRTELLEPGYAYARIAMFQADSGIELKRKLERLARDGKQPLRGLVLDLRSNPGGLLNSAVEVADLFVEQGVLVTTRGRLPASNAVFRAAPGDLLAGAPIVVLTDAGTASAAEVVAGALRDQRRAVVMGSVSFGKGSVQTLLPLDNGDAIKITTARYYTPDGTSIQAAGIVPDIRLPENVELRDLGDRPPSVREANLPRHLGQQQEDAAVTIGPAPGVDEDGFDDYAVKEALNLLKGLAVFGARTAGDEVDEG